MIPPFCSFGFIYLIINYFLPTRKEKAHHHHDVGYTGEVWYREGPHRNGGKQVRAAPGQKLSYKDKEIKPPEKC